MSQWFYDCPKCGEVGRLEELQSHPTRPLAEDLGFCPHCGCEIDDLMTIGEAQTLIESYGDDWSEFLAQLPPPSGDPA